MREKFESASVQMKFHGMLTIFWFTFTVPALYLGLLKSVTFVSILSLYALGIGHFSSWQAAKVEVRQDEIESNRDSEVEERIEKKVEHVTQKIEDIVPEESAKKTVEKLNGHK